MVLLLRESKNRKQKLAARYIICAGKLYNLRIWIRRKLRKSCMRHTVGRVDHI